MSKQTLAIVGVLAVTFGAGVGVGFFVSHDPSRSDLPSTTSTAGSTSSFFSDAVAQGREQDNAVLSARIRDLEKELTNPTQDRRAILADRLGFFKKYRKQIQIEPVTEEMEVTPEMAALLDLTPGEKKAIQQHLDETKAELDKMQDSDTVLSKQTDTSVAYDIAADKEGSALKDKLQGLLTSDMGEDRADIFMNTSSYNYTHQLDGFMEGKRQIVISWTEQNNQRVYTVQQTTYDASGASTGSSSMSGGGMLQPEFQKYLPDGMKP